MKALLNLEKQNLLITSFGGFFLILLGIMAIFSPFVSGIAITEIIALLVAAAGMTIFLATFYVPGTKKKILSTITGVLTILAGGAMFFLPLMSLYTLTGVAIAFFIIDGAFTTYSAIQQRNESGWGWILFSGIMSFILAGLLITEWPASGLYAIGMLVGVRLIVSGWTLMMLGLATGTLISAVSKELEDENNGIVSDQPKAVNS